MAVADAAGVEMTGRFDPSAFIAAEVSQTVAAPCDGFSATFATPKTPDFREVLGVLPQSVASVATVAGGNAEKLPWDDDLLPWAAGRRPPFATPEVWDALTSAALDISRTWGPQAVEMGWTSLDLFGCWRRPWFRRLDCNGLVKCVVGLLTPVRVTGIDPKGAELSDHTGPIMRYYRMDMPFSVNLWEGYSMPTGP